jgi:hypothetical protein
MLSIEEGKIAVEYAREIIDAYGKKEKMRKKEFPPSFDELKGVFVTINTYPEKKLRGCIGIPEPIMSLKQALAEAAKSACNDPRFFPLKEAELNQVVVEVTVLSPPELIEVNKPKDYLDKIKIGKDGLIIRKSFYSGLLLPQVPVEWKWGVEEFLAQLCIKAGLLADAWLEEDTKIYKFQGQIFAEVEPHGKALEKRLE